MAVNHRKVKFVEFSLGGPSPAPVAFQCQVQNWQLVNNTEQGERFFSQCPDGEFREDADDDWSLEVTFFADWQDNGISDWLWEHNNETVNFVIGHHPDSDTWNVEFSGQVKIMAPTVNGTQRVTEMTQVTLPIVGMPEYTRPS